MNGEINWSQPIEAVHEDGSTIRLNLQAVKEFGGTNPDRGGDIWTQSIPPFPGDVMCWSAPHFTRRPWHIRNVATPPADARTAPNGGEVGPEVVERLKRAVQAYARNERSLIASGNSVHAELVELAALLPEPVDADLVEARAAVSEMSMFSGIVDQIIDGQHDSSPIVVATLNAIRSRALEKEAGR